MSDTERPQEFVVTARKWRPLNFSSVSGQEHITQTLKNAILSERIHHAYLFSGPRGVGKTTCARILARAVNCLNPKDAEPCNECENCRGVLDSRSLDVIEIDGASNNSVEDIRKLRENAKYPPSIGRYKMYIIDEVHMLSTSAFNALLKTLEEPPPHLLFIFATTESHKVPATILSRCQRFEFRAMEIESITSRLRFIAERENITIDEDSLITIAQKADGSMRDSQSIFDQVVAFCGNDVKYTEMSDALHLVDREFYFRISSAITQKNTAEIFEISRQISAKGYDLQECLSGIIEHFRNVLSVKVSGDLRYIDVKNSFTERYLAESKEFSKTDLMRILQILGNTEQNIRFAHQPKIKFETTLIQIASLESALDAGALMGAIRDLKLKIPDYAAEIAKLPAVSPVQTGVSHGEIPTSTPKAIIPPFAPAQKKNDSLAEPAQKAAVISNVIADIGNDKQTLASHWSDFIEKKCGYADGLQLIADSNQFEPHFEDGIVEIRVGSDFLADMIKKISDKLALALASYFGKGTKHIVTIKENRSHSDELIRTAVSSKPLAKPEQAPPLSKEKRLEGKSETEKAIIEIFDAAELKQS